MSRLLRIALAAAAMLAATAKVHAQSALYYIDVDHLNTPRMITNGAQQVVWRWDQQEPFGANVPDENPSNLGAFEFPQRFAGQYFDKETYVSYNYFRDYDPTIGRYVESDPVGVDGGINTYLYGFANPLSNLDPRGLRAFCLPWGCWDNRIPPTDNIPPRDPKLPGKPGGKDPGLCAKIQPLYTSCHGCCSRNFPGAVQICIELCMHRDPPYPDVPVQTKSDPLPPRPVMACGIGDAL